MQTAEGQHTADHKPSKIGKPLPDTPELRARVMARLWGTDNPEACWIWQGCTDRRGYGTVGHKGKNYRVNRLMLAWSVGNLAGDVYACHNCPGGDNPRCCNPAHLFPGKPRENSLDATKKGRFLAGERCSWAKLTDAEVETIRFRYAAGGVTQVQLAAEYNVSQANISDIVLLKIRSPQPDGRNCKR